MDKANDLKDQAEAQAMEHVNAMKDKLKMGFSDNLGKYRFFTVGCAVVSLIAAFANLIVAMSFFKEDKSYQVSQYNEDLKMTLTFTVPTTGLPQMYMLGSVCSLMFGLMCVNTTRFQDNLVNHYVKMESDGEKPSAESTDDHISYIKRVTLALIICQVFADYFFQTFLV
jgi:hypothetical protein